MGTREDILEAANAAYSRGGYEGLSMRALATEVGISPMAIYRHFKDKDDLLHHVALHGLALWKQRMVTCAKVTDPLERIIEVGKHYVSFARDHRPHFDATFMSTDKLGSLKHHTATGALAFEELFAVYTSWVRECLGMGPTIDEAREHSVDIWAFSHGLLALYLAGRLGFLECEFGEYHSKKLRAFLSAKMENKTNA